MDQCILDYVNLFTLPSNSTSKVVLFPQGQFFPGRWSYCSSTLERGDRRDMFCEVQDPLGRVYNKSRKPSDFKDSKEQQVKKLDSIQEKKPYMPYCWVSTLSKVTFHYKKLLHYILTCLDHYKCYHRPSYLVTSKSGSKGNQCGIPLVKAMDLSC